MPCNMMSDITPGEIEASVARRKAEEAIAAANNLADILCRVMRALPPETIAALDPDVRAWFEQHKAHDRRQGRP